MRMLSGGLTYGCAIGMTGETIEDADNNPLGAAKWLSVATFTKLLVSWFLKHAKLPDGISFNQRRWRVLYRFSPKEFDRFFSYPRDFDRSAGLQSSVLGVEWGIGSNRAYFGGPVALIFPKGIKPILGTTILYEE